MVITIKGILTNFELPNCGGTPGTNDFSSVPQAIYS